MTDFYVSVAPHPERRKPGPNFYSYVYGRSSSRPKPVCCVICGEAPAQNFTRRATGDDSGITAFWCAACENREGLRTVTARVDTIIDAVLAASKENFRDYLLRQNAR